MASNLEEVCADVLKEISPSFEERNRVLKLAQQLTKKVKMIAKRVGVTAKVRVEGSVAKDTWLSGEPDIDIFLRVPTSIPREAFGTVCLDIAKKATEGFEQVERFADHPYIEAIINGIRINIVPCYSVRQGEWKSATDRTPFHTDYVKPILDERLRTEVRFLKRFMKGIGVYGAEIRVGGFSGYLCELIILNFGSFFHVLESFADWKTKMIIDYAGFYDGRREVERIFEEPLVMIDPIDKGRNVAASVRRERLDEFIVASRFFLKNPHRRFFYKEKIEAMTTNNVTHALKNRGSVLVYIKFGRVETAPDILWGQLFRTQKSIRNMLRKEDFTVISDSVWSNETFNFLLFEVQQRFLPSFKKHLGPPIEKRLECERFLQKHHEASHTIFGPRVENGRWITGIRRKYTDVVDLLKDKLSDGGRRIGVGYWISRSIREGFEVFSDEEILEFYSSNQEFANFLTEYLRGKPSWLE